MENSTLVIIIALIALTFGIAVALGALWHVRATMDRDRARATTVEVSLREELARQGHGATAAIWGLRASNECMRRELLDVAADAALARKHLRTLVVSIGSGGELPVPGRPVAMPPPTLTAEQASKILEHVDEEIPVSIEELAPAKPETVIVELPDDHQEIPAALIDPNASESSRTSLRW